MAATSRSGNRRVRSVSLQPLPSTAATSHSDSGNGRVRSVSEPLPATAATPTEGGRDDSTASSSAQAVTNLAAAAIIEATPTEGGTNSTAAPVVLAPDEGNNRPRTLVSSLLSKLCRRGDGLDNNGPAAAGVTVPADIGKLAVLHTLGVVKVNAQCGNKAIFQELKKLTQLRKLGVSGINKGNIHEFCSAITDHAHLKSLSMELDKDDGLDNIPEPPKTIKRLKLYGRVHKLFPVWMEHLDHLEKLHLTIEKPDELRDLPELSKRPRSVGHLRIRPIQDGTLFIGHSCWNFVGIVEIQCSSRLYIKVDDWNRVARLRVLKVHFSTGSQSSLEISGLSSLRKLKEVWLKGYSDADKQYMQRQIDEMRLPEGQIRPVLKLVQTRSLT